jgi:hypothetical protein
MGVESRQVLGEKTRISEPRRVADHDEITKAMCGPKIGSRISRKFLKLVDGMGRPARELEASIATELLGIFE